MLCSLVLSFMSCNDEAHKRKQKKKEAKSKKSKIDTRKRPLLVEQK